MLINETSKITNLTKKSIEYYIMQGLLSPVILENGYRDFTQEDVERLKKISVLRKLGVGVEEIKAVLDDETGETLQKLSVQKELSVQREQAKKVILDKLSCGKNYSEISEELKAIEQGISVAEKLLEAFPGYYGRFICLHFARFLNEPIITNDQKSAYEEVVKFLDQVSPLNFPEDLQEYLIENTKNISTENITKMLENTKDSIEKPEEFLSKYKEMLEEYLEYKQSEEFKNSPAYKIQSLLKEFNSTSGYYDIFIPAMKRLSTSYAEYYKQLEIADKKLLAEYPEIKKLYY
jgi:DNA-binding transcriptional MerR regulator